MATQLKASAPGYNDTSIDVNVVDSGFRLPGYSSATAVDSSRNIPIQSARLNANGTFSATQPVRGGASFDIMVSSSLPGVGTVSSPVTIANGEFSNVTTFTGVSAGTTNISITQPAGITAPVGLTDQDMVVEE